MQTLKIKIEDNFLQEFLSIVEHYKGKIQIEKDENLVIDPYFYERRKQLQQALEDMVNDKIDMLSQKQYDQKVDQFLAALKAKYEN